jgi:MFS family permease
VGYRWVVLTVGTAAQASFAAFTIGLSVMLPDIRTAYGLSLAQTGLVLAAANVGTMLGMLPWGVLAGGVATLAAAHVTAFAALAALLAIGGFGGASVSAASGRAVMQWFPRTERGLALGIRQAAVPVAGAVSAVVLPPLVARHGVDAGLSAIGLGVLACAALAGVFFRDAAAPAGASPGPAVAQIARDSRTWLLAGSAALLVVPQIALFGFTVLFLHDHRGLSPTQAAAVFAVAQVLAVTARVGVGRWSDLAGSRIRPLRFIALASCAAAAVTAVAVDGPLPVLVPAIVWAGLVTASWNGLAYVAAAEAVGPERSGAALGVQQTVLFGAGAAAAPLLALVFDRLGWAWGFGIMAFAPLAAFALLGRVGERVAA